MKAETKNRIAAWLNMESSFDMALFEPLSQTCAGELSRRMRAGADPEEECPEVYALAVSLLMRAEAAGEQAASLPGSFTVGGVSMSGLTPESERAALRQRAYRLLRDYLPPADFAFRGVPT